MVNRPLIRAAGEYLLTVLSQEDQPVPYSRFYNADPGTAVSLVEGMWPNYLALAERYPEEFAEGEKQDFLKDAHRYIEWAARQLEDIRVVWIDPLEGKLIDGTQDFHIGLTERGKEFVADDETFGYRRPDSRVNVLSASECLIKLLQDADHSPPAPQEAKLRDLDDLDQFVDQSPPTLSKAMLSGLGGLSLVSDDCGNAYEYGSHTDRWGFLVCLWHHVTSGVISPEFETDTQRAEWDDFFAKHKKLFGRSVALSVREISRVPLRLTPKALEHPDTIRHLEWIGEE